MLKNHFGTEFVRELVSSGKAPGVTIKLKRYEKDCDFGD